MLDNRRVSVQNEERTKITDNKTIIEHALEHAKDQVRPKGIVGKINHVRLWKKSILLCEIMGIEGTRITDYGERYDEESKLKRNFKIT